MTRKYVHMLRYENGTISYASMEACLIQGIIDYQGLSPLKQITNQR